MAIAVALLVSISFASAQNGKVFQTKAQTLGLKTGQVHATYDKTLANGSRDMLLEENFDTDGLFPPTDWSQIIFNTNNTWEQGNVTDHDFNVVDPNSLFSAICPWVAADQDEWLITSEVNANGETPLNLVWYAGTSGSWLEYATLKCLISTDDGTTWTELWDAYDEIDPAADWDWNKITINLDAYAGTPFKIAWEYVGNDGDLAAVDGVEISSGYNYIFQDDFESYNVGDYLALNSNTWTTWSNAPGTNEDAFVVYEQAASPTKSVEIDQMIYIIYK